MEVAYWFGGLFLLVMFIAYLRARSRSTRESRRLGASVERTGRQKHK